jgi:hypothetical protein
MNTPRFLPILLLGISGLASSFASDVSPISMRVEQVASHKTTKTDDTQTKSLKVFLTNASAQEQAVNVKYYFFAKDVASRDVTVVSPGEKSATVKPHGEEIVETGSGTATSHPKQPGQKGAKPVEASGQKLIGYGAQAMQGDKVVAEYFSEPSLKSNVGGGEKAGDKPAGAK